MNENLIWLDTNFYKLGMLSPSDFAKYLVYPSGTFAHIWKTTWCDRIYESYESAISDTVQWLNAKAPEKKLKCKDCDCCHLTSYTRWSPQKQCMHEVKVYECWGVKEPFEIKDINCECTEW